MRSAKKQTSFLLKERFVDQIAFGIHESASIHEKGFQLSLQTGIFRELVCREAGILEDPLQNAGGSTVQRRDLKGTLESQNVGILWEQLRQSGGEEPGVAVHGSVGILRENTVQQFPGFQIRLPQQREAQNYIRWDVQADGGHPIQCD